MKKKLFVLALSLLVSVAFSQEMKTFTKDNYTIDYDSAWEINGNQTQPGVQFMIMSNESTQTKDGFRENINLASESLKGQVLTASEYLNIALEQIKAQIPTAKIISSKSIDINGIDANETVWSADFGNNMVLQFKQVALVRGGNGYVLTFSSSTAEYKDHIKSADLMMKSFKFVN